MTHSLDLFCEVPFFDDFDASSCVAPPHSQLRLRLPFALASTLAVLGTFSEVVRNFSFVSSSRDRKRSTASRPIPSFQAVSTPVDDYRPLPHRSPYPPPPLTPPPSPPPPPVVPHGLLALVMSPQRRGANSSSSDPPSSHRSSPSSSAPKSLSTLALVGLAAFACLSPVVQAALYEPPGDQVLFGAWLDTDVGTFPLLQSSLWNGGARVARMDASGLASPRMCDGGVA